MSAAASGLHRGVHSPARPVIRGLWVCRFGGAETRTATTFVATTFRTIAL